MERKVAIFDVDGTIFRSSLLIELVNVLVERQIFPEEARFKYSSEHVAWLNRQDSYEHYIKAVVQVFREYIKGIDSKIIESIAEEIMVQHESRTYRYTRDLVKKLKDEGYYLLLISHSPKIILEKFGMRHRFDKIYGSFYTINEDGRFTGEITDYDLIMNKAEILRRATKKEKLTLEDSIGIGDTESDITFLSLVSQPICFNPNKALYEHAKSKGWKVVVERKDVIYEL